MAIAARRHIQMLSRHAGTRPNRDPETSPMTLEEWKITSGIADSLSSASHVQVSVEDYERDEGSETASPQFCMIVSISTKVSEDSISILIDDWNLLSLDYTKAEIWLALSSHLRTLKLTGLPDFLRGGLSYLHQLELRGSPDGNNGNSSSRDNTLEMDDVADFSDGSEPKSDTHHQALFTSEEMGVLVDLLVSPLCRLESLDCTLCSFGPDSVRSFVQAMAANQTLQRVTLKYCNIAKSSNVEQAIGVRTGINNLRVLRIEECSLEEGAMEEAIVEILRSSTSLKEIYFVKAEAPLSAARRIAEYLLDHSRLESLDLSGLDITIDGLQAIGELVASSNVMTSLTLSELPQCIDLSFLADALLSNTSLTRLDLSMSRLGRGDALGKALQGNLTLQQLNLSRCTWQDDDENDSTDDTDLSVPSFYASLGAGCCGLQQLDLSCMHLSSRDVSDLAASLRENCRLERLLLNDLDCTFEPVSLESVFLALRDNTHLRVLELGRNSFRDDEIETLMTSLATNQSLESLTLSGCGLTDAVMIKLAPSLKEFSLKDLDLSFNDIGHGGATTILEVLPKGTKLRSLSLHNSCWSVGGPTHFVCDGFEDINEAIQDCLDQRKGQAAC